MSAMVPANADTEVAPYEVLAKEEKIELRKYQNLVLAVTPMSMPKQRNSAFRRLFGYISGKNSKAQKMEMTAPVFMDYLNSETGNMAFVLPERFSLADAPKPNDDSLKIEEMPPTTFATIRFSGRLTERNISKHKLELDAWLKEKNMLITGTTKTAGYNSPFTLPFMRRNEVLIPVEFP